MMEIYVSRRMVDIGYNKNLDRFLTEKDSSNHCFPVHNFRNNNQKAFCRNIFETLELLLRAENISKNANLAYNYILENFNEDIKWEWGSLENNYNLCAGIAFFLNRKYGIFVKKLTLAKIFGIKISCGHKIFDILKEMSYFKDLITVSEKKENIFEIIEFIPVFGGSLKQKKPPKEIVNEFPKSPFFPFFFLFYVFVQKLILTIIVISIPIEQHSHQDSMQIIRKNNFLTYLKKWEDFTNSYPICRILHMNTVVYFLKNRKCGFISIKNLSLQTNILNCRHRKNMNSKLNPKSKNLKKLEILPPPAKEVKCHRITKNRSCVKNIDFNFFQQYKQILVN